MGFEGSRGAARPLALRPMNIGDLLDGSVRLFVANWQAVLLVVSVVIVPVQIVVAWLQRDIFDDGLFQLFTDPAALEAAAGESPFDAGQIGGLLISGAVSTLVLPVLAGAVCVLVAGTYRGEPVDWRAALRTAGARFGALIGASILVHLVQALPVLVGVGVLVAAAVTESLALLALGLLLLLAGVLCAIALSALYTATAPAIVIDGVGAVSGMRRSWQLRRPRFWPTVGAVLLAGLLSAVVGQAITTIPTVLALGFGGPFAWVIVAASGIVAQLVQVPFLTIFSTLLYFDGRIRREGFDLELLAHELGG